MAERLHVSPATVRNHVQHILEKLGVHSRLEAAAYATRRGCLRLQSNSATALSRSSSASGVH
jgi:two-component system nitrate/nitrite response regulator NarL